MKLRVRLAPGSHDAVYNLIVQVSKALDAKKEYESAAQLNVDDAYRRFDRSIGNVERELVEFLEKHVEVIS